MTRKALWFLGVGVTVILFAVIACLTFVPGLLYQDLTDAQLRAVPSAETRIQLQQAQGQLQNNARSTLLQAVAGLLVLVGAGATLRQVQVNREGQVTERFTRAVDQVGGDNVDVRIGGIYALERVAKNSPSDRPQVQYILGAFVRGHAPWLPDGDCAPDESLPWLYVRAPDVQAALSVLARRPRSPETPRLYLSRVDGRSANLDSANMVDSQMRHANFARSWLVAASFDRSDLCYTDFRQARAVRARFRDTALRGADFDDADVTGADFRRADLRAARMRARHLDQADLTGAVADSGTVWPNGFDAAAAGVVAEGVEQTPPEDPDQD